MNTAILMGAAGDPARLATGFQRAEELVHQHEQRFTRFRDTSELANLNRSAGQWFAASPETYEVVRLAYGFFRQTGGLFNPGILQALEQAGYDRSLEQVQASVAAGPPANALNVPDKPANRADFGQTRFNPARQLICLPAGLRIDLGGIAKGWIAEQAANLLAQYADACLVDAGGDMFAVGRPKAAQDWMVALEDPFNPSRDLTILSIRPGAVATSTTMKRHWQQDGQERHHLIDPRTGLPAQTDWVSVTVIAAHTALAEVLAKSLLIAGPVGSGHLVGAYPQAVVLAVDKNGRIWGSENAQEVMNASIQYVS